MAITATPAAWQSFWQTVGRVQRSRLEPRIALRNTIGVALPLAVGAALGQLGAGLIVATGALNVAFRDSHAPYPERARQLLAASLVAGMAVTAGSWSGTHALTAVLMACLWAFGAGLLVAIGERAANLGMMSVVLLVIFAAVPLGPRQAALAGMAAFGGGVLQTLLAVALWPLGRHAPQRRALAGLYRALAGAALSPHSAVEAPLATAQMIDTQTMLAHERSAENQRFQFLFSLGERARVALLALARIRLRLSREGSPDAETLVSGGLVLAARRFSMIADTLELTRRGTTAAGDAESWEAGRFASLSEQLRRAEAPEPVQSMLRDARVQFDALAGQLRAALEVARQSAPSAAVTGRRPPRPWLRDAFSTLRANFTLQSIACRHGLRMAMCVTAGDALGRALGLARPYWIPMTIALVLKPDFTTTFSRGVQRLAGTYVGLLMATALFHALPASLAAQIAAIAALMYAARWAGGANYGFVAIAVAGLAVLLLSLEGATPGPLILARGIDTTLGGAIALLAYALWPTWERGRVSSQLAHMLEAFRGYSHAVCAAHGAEPAGVQPLEDARAAGRLARTNLEAIIERTLAEPGTSSEAAARLRGIVASARRVAHALMSLEAALHAAGTAPPAFLQFAADVEATFGRLAARLRDPAHDDALPDLREAYHALLQSAGAAAAGTLVSVEADRITNSVNTLGTELLGWLALQTPSSRAARADTAVSGGNRTVR